MTTTRVEQKRWLEQWAEARFALRELKIAELAAMTEEEAHRATLSVLALGALAPLSPARISYSGLVEQQSIFLRRLHGAPKNDG